MNIEWHGKPFALPKLKISDEYLNALSNAVTDAFCEEPTDTTIASILHDDQANAASDALAKRIGSFYASLKASGMSDETASSITESFVSFEMGSAYGVNVAEVFGVSPGWED